MKKILIGFYILVVIGIIFCISNSNIFDKKNSQAIEAGEKVYKTNCLVCHGETGKGEGKYAGTALNNQHFLNSVTDKTLSNYIKFGREGTGMPAYGPRLSAGELKNLTAFIRNWQTEEIKFNVPKNITGNPENGKKLYDLYCKNCHMDNGAGMLRMGTALSHRQYLKFTTDKQIWISTAYGREGTRMGPSLKGLDGVRQLKKQDISNIVMYIRSLEEKK
ncbi:c-type cytochrome [Bacillus sp. USDA818B3_A]|uniref:c-type cytochrome n=1 Tax=Bacillus sp. USDA818B3_A TaxID=2698834 RepID=UPI001371DD4A|nr:c-type cytochrome [Bacillus sp. USDA818B3_A]